MQLADHISLVSPASRTGILGRLDEDWSVPSGVDRSKTDDLWDRSNGGPAVSAGHL